MNSSSSYNEINRSSGGNNNLNSNNNPWINEKPFHEVHIRATDEIFYKRAVDYSIRVNSSSFVYTVPFDAASRRSDAVLVTAAQAVFVGTSKQKSPAAVVGLLFKHKSFSDRFFSHTSRCGSPSCKVNCSDETTECFLLDNNGYIIVSEDFRLTGKFLGEYDYSLLELLVEKKVYVKKRMFDYQAICIDLYQVSGPGSMLMTPLNLMRKALVWLWTRLTLAAVDIYLNPFNNPLSFVFGAEEEEEDEEFSPNLEVDESRKIINKTRPRPCIKEHETL